MGPFEDPSRPALTRKRGQKPLRVHAVEGPLQIRLEQRCCQSLCPGRLRCLNDDSGGQLRGSAGSVSYLFRGEHSSCLCRLCHLRDQPFDKLAHAAEQGDQPSASSFLPRHLTPLIDLQEKFCKWHHLSASDITRLKTFPQPT